MTKILPYIYFAVAAIWLTDGIREFLQEKEFYHIFLNYKTTNKYWFLAFKLTIGVLVIFAGLRRWKMAKDSEN